MQDAEEITPEKLIIIMIIQSLANTYQKNTKNLAGILLAVYCLSGCDTVSFPFRKGKRKALKLAISNEACLDLIHFGSISINGYQISESLWTSCRAFFKNLYGRPNFMGNMDELRAHIFPNCKTDIRCVTLISMVAFVILFFKIT